MRMQPPTNIARGVLAVVLVPVLVFFLWLEVAIGTSFAWGELVGYVSPSHPQFLWGVLMLIATITGPLSSIVVVWSTGHRSMSNVDRLLYLEGVGLLIAIPLVVLGVLLIAATSFI
jgi:hypothetical protein